MQNLWINELSYIHTYKVICLPEWAENWYVATTKWAIAQLQSKEVQPWLK